MPYAWQKANETIGIPSKLTRNISTLGFLDINNQNLFSYTMHDKVDSEVVVAIFDEFVKTISKTTVVVLDNASIHRSKLFKSNIEKWKKKGLLLFYLPPYSPELNLIEILWRRMKYHWIELDAYTSFENLKNFIEKILANYGNGDYEILFK